MGWGHLAVHSQSSGLQQPREGSQLGLSSLPAVSLREVVLQHSSSVKTQGAQGCQHHPLFKKQQPGPKECVVG